MSLTSVSKYNQGFRLIEAFYPEKSIYKRNKFYLRKFGQNVSAIIIYYVKNWDILLTVVRSLFKT